MGKKLQKITISAIFIAIGSILPMLFAQLKEVGNMLLPMHFVILLCGLICGPIYGMISGFILPLFRSMVFSMPVMFPDAVVMSFEIATYGFVAGYLYENSKYRCIFSLYKCIIPAMILGRIVWVLGSMICFGIIKNSISISVLFISAFINSFPGIIIQLIFIPLIMITIKKTSFYLTY